MFDKSRYYRVDEVADILSVGKLTVYRLIQNGEISAYKVQSCTRMRGDDLNAYLERNKLDPLGIKQ